MNIPSDKRDPDLNISQQEMHPPKDRVLENQLGRI